MFSNLMWNFGSFFKSFSLAGAIFCITTWFHPTKTLATKHCHDHRTSHSSWLPCSAISCGTSILTSNFVWLRMEQNHVCIRMTLIDLYKMPAIGVGKTLGLWRHPSALRVGPPQCRGGSVEPGVNCHALRDREREREISFYIYIYIYTYICIHTYIHIYIYTYIHIYIYTYIHIYIYTYIHIYIYTYIHIYIYTYIHIYIYTYIHIQHTYLFCFAYIDMFYFWYASPPQNLHFDTFQPQTWWSILPMI